MRPKSLEELIAAVEEANKSGTGMLPVCMGSKAWIGPPVKYDEVLNLDAMPKRIEVDVEEQVARVSACVSMREVEAELEKRGATLAMDPPLAKRSSLGGVVATNFYGALAYRYFPPRDRLLKTVAVTGGGQLVSFGAPVMKDVAGYNLKRLLAGSWGTLAVLVEIYIRVYARPERVAVAATSPLDLTQLRRLRPTAALEKDGVLLLRFEGVPAEVEYRLSRVASGEVYYDREAVELWAAAAEGAEVFSNDFVYKVVAPPAEAPRPSGRYIKYPLLGVVYATGPPPRGAWVLKPQSRWEVANRDLMLKIKNVFDPRGVLSPGRI
ncbi:MAG: FAD-binding oxidoreductase [Pyrobaculum sp.]